ncbi:MAG TPA: hypothetical protein VLF39_04165 [Candidatus Saccharimonadales bacterium]|nr:hypothetical protein [Candidatus Saccharimonadales bacterium]
MREQSKVECNGSIFKFEPPVKIRDDEPPIGEEEPVTTLERLATVAWYGTEFPRGLADQTCEEMMVQYFEDVKRDPREISNKLNTILKDKYEITLVTE